MSFELKHILQYYFIEQNRLLTQQNALIENQNKQLKLHLENMRRENERYAMLARRHQRRFRIAMMRLNQQADFIRDINHNVEGVFEYIGELGSDFYDEYPAVQRVLFIDGQSDSLSDSEDSII